MHILIVLQFLIDILKNVDLEKDDSKTNSMSQNEIFIISIRYYSCVFTISAYFTKLIVISQK